MNYYEELGIEPSASGEDIHRAHRRLTRLLHPDHQTDSEVKRLAETQMRRLNAMVEILADPDKRRQYDQLLNQPVAVLGATPGNSYLTPTRFKVPGPGFDWHRIWQFMPWWIWSTLGALLLTFSVVWFLAENLGSSFGRQSLAYVPPSSQETGSTSSKSAGGAGVRAGVPTKGLESPLEVLSDRIRDVLTSHKSSRSVETGAQPVPAPTQAAETPAVAANRPFIPPNLTVSVPVEASNSEQQLPPPPSLNLTDVPRAAIPHVLVRPEIAKLAPPPSAAQIVTARIPTSAPVAAPAPKVQTSMLPELAKERPRPQDPLEGEWIYSPREREKKKSGLFPPEFINLKLFREQGALRGQYRARYHVVGRPYSPEVSFILVPYEQDSRKFAWQSSNGSRGMLRINPIDAGSIKVEWRTTVFSREPSLTAGTATLVRRSPSP